MKGCVQWNLVYGWKDFRPELGLNMCAVEPCLRLERFCPGLGLNQRPLHQWASAASTELLGLLLEGRVDPAPTEWETSLSL